MLAACYNNKTNEGSQEIHDDLYASSSVERAILSSNTKGQDENINDTSDSSGILIEKVDDPANCGYMNLTNGYKTKADENGRCFIAEAGALKSDAKQGAVFNT
jgi:hypothetical protein